MSFMEAWWNTLSALQQGLALLAIPATVILLLQTILLLFGIGGHDADHGETDVADDLDADDDADGAADTDADADTEADIPAHHGAHHAAGIRLFTLRGIVALFAVGGWLGIAMCDLGLSPALSIVIALLGGDNPAGAFPAGKRHHPRQKRDRAYRHGVYSDSAVPYGKRQSHHDASGTFRGAGRPDRRDRNNSDRHTSTGPVRNR